MPTSFRPTAEMVDAVAEWRSMRADNRITKPLVPLLVHRFGISITEAVAIIRFAQTEARDGSS